MPNMEMYGMRCAAAPTRMEWYWNIMRMLQKLSPGDQELLGVGTMVNKARHAELKAMFKERVFPVW